MPRRLSGGGDIYEARRVKTLMQSRGAGGTGMAAVPQPVAQNDMLLANSLLFWSLLTGPTAAEQVLISGADPFVPAWAGLFDATVPNVIQPDDPAAVGSAATAARRDHEHGIVCAAPAANSVNLAASAEGSATSFARSDHTHNLDESITPTWTGIHTHAANVVLDDGAGNSPVLQFMGGSNDDIARIFLWDDAVAGDSDLAIQLCAADTGSQLTILDSTYASVAYIDAAGNAGFGGHAYVGGDLWLTGAGTGIIHTDGVVAGQFLRANGTRYVPDTLDVADLTDLAYAVPALTFGVANAAGVADTVIRSDATLAIFDAVVPDVIQCDDAAATGAAAVAARRDHTHGIVCAAPAANLSVSTTNAEGAATSFARSDHSHAIASSSNPGAAASILATTAAGHLQLVGLGIGAAPANNAVVLPTGGYIGITGNETLTVNAAGNFTFSGITSIVVPDGCWVGADAACSWVFDSTNGDVTTLDKVGVGTAAPSKPVEIATPVSDNTETLLKLSHRSGTLRVGSVIELGSNETTGMHTRLIGYAHPNATWNTQFEIQTSNAENVWNTGLYQDGDGNIGINDDSPDARLDVVESDAITAATTDVIILEHITSGTAAANFGASLLYQLEDAGGTVRDAARLVTVWQSAASAESAEFQLWLNYDGTLYDCGIVVGPGTTVAGNQRGIAAVDWQGTRGAATQVASGLQAVVSGGVNNTASGSQSCVVGGSTNTAVGTGSSVLGGHDNTANVIYATTIGGTSNLASGTNALAAGYDAHATHTYSMVFSATNAQTISWAANTWTARCHGGARFYSAAGVGTGVQLSAGGNAWAGISDRAVKENFRAVDDILGKIAALPLYDYNLKSQDASIRHIGPVAQDFNEIFGFTEDALRINSMDISGVTLAGVKALIAENESLEERVLSLETERSKFHDRDSN